MKTTLLTLKTAVIVSSLCQKAQEKAQTHHFSFSEHPANMSSDWKNNQTAEKCTVLGNEEQIHEVIVALCSATK